jgi:predicted ATP-grasp superfamily ATP-dependent carboligase
MKKVLLLDTNVSSFPIYNFLVESGYEVYVAGTKPSDCLAKYTDNYINIDYSNLYFLEDIITAYDFDFLVPGCNDMSYISATRVNNKNKFYGLDTTEVSEIINNKSKFRKFAIDNNLSVPMVYAKDEIYELSNPIIVKPADAYSGRGVSIVKDINKSNIDTAIENAINYSKNKECVIEEYVEGQLYSHTAFISDKKIIIDFFVIEDCTANKFTVDTSYVVNDFPDEIKNEIKNQIEFIASKLDLVDGLMHTQFIKTQNSFKIIEVTRRCPGDLYSNLIKISTDFDYVEYYTKPFINQKIYIDKFERKENSIIRHTISSSKILNYLGIQFNENIEIKSFIPLSITGDQLKESPFSRFGLIFIDCKSEKKLKKIYQNILKRKLYNFT